MLNFVAVAFGTSEDTLAFCERIRRLFREKICNEDVHIYDREFINAMRTDPGLFDSCSRFAFVLKPHGFKKEYCGFFKDGYSGTDEIASRLFGAVTEDYGMFVDSVNSTEYNEQRMFYEIDRHFKSEEDENEDVDIDSDFEIGFELTRLELDCYYAHARISFDTGRIQGRAAEFVDWFRYVIKFCDVNFSNCFHSAYISNNPKGLEVAHAAVFAEHDKSDLEFKLLGCEWYTYICQRISDTFDEKTTIGLSQIADFERHTNGISYTLKTPLADYRTKDSLAIYELLGDKIISGVSMLRWDEFVTSRRRLTCPIEGFIVYRDMIGDEYLLIIYKCTTKKLSALVNTDYKSKYKSYRRYHY